MINRLLLILAIACASTLVHAVPDELEAGVPCSEGAVVNPSAPIAENPAPEEPVGTEAWLEDAETVEVSFLPTKDCELLDWQSQKIKIMDEVVF